MEPWTIKTQAKYLKEYGYPVAASRILLEWESLPELQEAKSGGCPQLDISLLGHEEKDGHTLYQVRCNLTLPNSSCLDWCVQHRLKHIREELYEKVYQSLSPSGSYMELFNDSPFALRGGLPGTTARLNGWLSTLADCTNHGSCEPALVCCLLRFLQAPDPPRVIVASSSAAAGQFSSAFDCAKATVKQQLEQARQQATEAASAAAMGFAKQHPQAAKTAMGYVGSNPEAGKAALGFMAKNPGMAVQALKHGAKGAARAF